MDTSKPDNPDMSDPVIDPDLIRQGTARLNRLAMEREFRRPTQSQCQDAQYRQLREMIFAAIYAAAPDVPDVMPGLRSAFEKSFPDLTARNPDGSLVHADRILKGE